MTRHAFPVGHYFLSFHPDGRWNWAGRVESRLAPSKFQIVIFDALMLNLAGSLDGSVTEIVDLDDMKGWEFHADRDAFACGVMRQQRICDRRDRQAATS